MILPRCTRDKAIAPPQETLDTYDNKWPVCALCASCSDRLLVSGDTVAGRTRPPAHPLYAPGTLPGPSCAARAWWRLLHPQYGGSRCMTRQKPAVLLFQVSILEMQSPCVQEADTYCLGKSVHRQPHGIIAKHDRKPNDRGYCGHSILSAEFPYKYSARQACSVVVDETERRGGVPRRSVFPLL